MQRRNSGDDDGRGSNDRGERVTELWRPSKPEGLARTIAKSGHASRAEAAEMVRQGRVKVDGSLETNPSVPVGPHSVILLDGQPLVEVARQYLAFNKPLRVVACRTDYGGHRLVRDFLPKNIPGLRPAGRLDAMTEGLLLVSNDSQWNEAAVGNHTLEKVYRIEVSGGIGDVEIGVITAGIKLPNLGFIKPLRVEIVEASLDRTIVRLAVAGAKNRQVRHIFSFLRHEVRAIRRLQIGPVELGGLAPGQYRHLTAAEIAGVREDLGRDTG